jgi:hypothetical protein
MENTINWERLQGMNLSPAQKELLLEWSKEPEKLTREQVNAQYGEALVRFSSYYKYEFFFSGLMGELSVSCSIGGNHDAIYRSSISANRDYAVEDLCINSLTICNPEGNKIAVFTDDYHDC